MLGEEGRGRKDQMRPQQEGWAGMRPGGSAALSHQYRCWEQENNLQRQMGFLFGGLEIRAR